MLNIRHFSSTALVLNMSVEEPILYVSIKLFSDYYYWGEREREGPK